MQYITVLLKAAANREQRCGRTEDSFVVTLCRNLFSLSQLRTPSPDSGHYKFVEKTAATAKPNSQSLTGGYSRLWAQGCYTYTPGYIDWRAGITISPSQGLRIWLMYTRRRRWGHHSLSDMVHTKTLHPDGKRAKGSASFVFVLCIICSNYHQPCCLLIPLMHRLHFLEYLQSSFPIGVTFVYFTKMTCISLSYFSFNLSETFFLQKILTT